MEVMVGGTGGDAQTMVRKREKTGQQRFWKVVEVLENSAEETIRNLKTPAEWMQFWAFVEASKTRRFMYPEQWMQAIIREYEEKEEVTPIMFQHLLMCSERTDTRIVTDDRDARNRVREEEPEEEPRERRKRRSCTKKLGSNYDSIALSWGIKLSGGRNNTRKEELSAETKHL